MAFGLFQMQGSDRLDVGIYHGSRGSVLSSVLVCIDPYVIAQFSRKVVFSPPRMVGSKDGIYRCFGMMDVKNQMRHNFTMCGLY